MDGHRFDHLTATLARGLQRRRLLATLFGTAVSAVLVWSENAVGKKKKDGCPKKRRCGENGCCRKDQVCIRDQCAPGHCGDGKRNQGETDADCGGSCRRFRQCGLAERCDQDEDCRQSFPSLLCVVRESFCPGARPGVKRCFNCRTDAACLRETPRCLCGECQECLRDEDCPVRGGPEENRFCVAPLAGNCPGEHPCKCRECRSNADCAAEEFCDDDNRCVPCAQRRGSSRSGRAEQCSTCGADQDFCVDGLVGCNGNDQCLCRQTVNNEPFCAQPGDFLSDCTSDQSCIDGLQSPGTRCVKQREPNCDTGSGGDVTSTCVLPCG
jgi:hypothetical protein